MKELALNIVFGSKDHLTPSLKNMLNISDQASDRLNSLRESVAKLDRQNASFKRFEQLKDKILPIKRELDQVKTAIETLEKQKLNGGLSKDMEKQLSKLQRNRASLQRSFDNLTPKVHELRQAFNQAGFKGWELSEIQDELANRAGMARDALEREIQTIQRLDQIQQRYTQTTERLNNIRQHAQTALVASGVVIAGLGSTVKNYAEGENAQMNLKVSMMTNTGEVAEEFKQLDALANKLGTKLPGSTSDFQNMMATLVQQGISAKAILGGVGEASGYLAVQMKLPFAEAAEFAAKMQDATKTSEQDMLALMDTIQKAYYLGVDKTNMLGGYSKIADGMKTIRMEGLAGAKAIAPLLVMADQASMDGGSAGNAFSKIFKAMMDTEKIKKALKDSKTGIDMNFTDGKGEFGGLDQMFQQLEKLKGLSTEARLPILSDMFGNDAETIQALNLLIDKGQAGYNETLAKMNAQADLQTRVNAQLGTLANLWDAAQGTFSSLLSRVGEALAPQLKNLTQWLTELTEKFTNWSNQHPVLFNNIVKFIAVTATLIAIFAGLAIAITTILAPFAFLQMTLLRFATTGTGIVGILSKFIPLFALLKTGILSIGKAFLTAGRVMLTNPMILAITALVAVIAGSAYLIYKHWDTIKAKAHELWQGVTQAFMTGINYIKGIIQSIDTIFANNPLLNILLPFIGIPRTIIANWSSITAFFSTLWTNISTTTGGFIANIVNSLSNAWNHIKMLTMTALHAVWSVVSSIFNQISAYISTIMTTIRNIVSTAWTALCNVFLTITPLGFIMRNFDSIIGYLSTLKDRFYAMGVNIIQGLINGVQTGFAKLKSLWAEVNSYMPDFMQKRMDIHSPSRLFKSFGGYIMQGLNIGLLAGVPQLQKHYGKVLDIFTQPPQIKFTPQFAGGASPMDKMFHQKAQPLLQTGLNNPVASPTLAPTSWNIVDKIPTYLQQSPMGEHIVKLAHKAQGLIDKTQQASRKIVHSALPTKTSQHSIQMAGDTININIYSTGENPNNIRQQVEQALQQHQRNKQARLRDSYADYL